MTELRPFTRSTRGVGHDGEPYEEIQHVRPAEYLDGRHCTAYVADVKEMKRAGDAAGATALLERLVAQLWTTAPDVPPWYVWELAVLYRAAGRDADERELLTHYVAVATTPGARGKRIAERLARLGT